MWKKEWQQRYTTIRHYCTRCVYNEKTPNIVFDTKGICNYCKQQDDLATQYPAGKIGEKNFLALVQKIKMEGKKKPYDVIVGVRVV